MISDQTFNSLIQAISKPSDYSKGAKRKQLQAVYDKMLDEVSVHIFNEPCKNKMVLRKKINGMENKGPEIIVLADLLKNDHLLFSKDYRDHGGDIEDFLENHMKHFLRKLRHE
jgi:hypothetical protein